MENQESPIKLIKFAIEFQDTGVGISKANQEKLFVDFGKLDEHSSINRQGTGLGLSICQKIVEQMGGKVVVESQVNEGTTFIISLVHQVQCSNHKPIESEILNEIIEQDDFEI